MPRGHCGLRQWLLVSIQAILLSVMLALSVPHAALRVDRQVLVMTADAEYAEYAESGGTLIIAGHGQA